MYSPLRQLLLLLLVLLPLVTAVFKDEAYQNDWHIPLLGPSLPTSTFFHRPLLDAKASLIYTLTSKSILAAVNPKDGEIVWRQSLGGDGTGIARAGDGIVVAGIGSTVKAFDTVDGRLVWGIQFADVKTVKDLAVVLEGGVNDVIVLFDDGMTRKLSGTTGDVIWEWKGEGGVVSPSLSLSHDRFILVSPKTPSELRYTVLDVATGNPEHKNAISTSSEPSVVYTSSSILAWIEASPRTLNLVPLGGKISVTTAPIPEDVRNVVIHNSHDAVLVHYQALSTSWVDVYKIDFVEWTISKSHSLDAKPGAKSALSISSFGGDIFFTWSLPNGDIFLYKTSSAETLAEYHVKEVIADIAISHVISEVFPRADGTYAVRTFASTCTPGFNGDTYLVLNGEIAWERKESLSTAVASTWVELLDPAAEEVAEELDVEGHQSVGAAYVHRVKRHIHELVTYGPDWFRGIPGRVLKAFGSSDNEEQKGGKWRDFFGYRKYVVIATAEGGLAAIDVGRKGEIAWQTSVLPADGEWKGVSALYEVGKGLIGVATAAGEYLEVDAFDGTLLKRESIGGEPKSTTIVDGDIGRKVILVVLGEDKVVVLPHGSQASVDPIYLVLQENDKTVKGLRINKALETQKTWTFTTPTNYKITSLTSRPFHDPVASIGKVLGDRSVMYKYLNPHLLAITSINPHSSTASIYLVDSVSGAVLYTTTHAGVDTTKPLVMTLSENWIVYTYFGDPDPDSNSPTAKGYRLVVSELFESSLPNDRLPGDTFSSFDGTLTPFVLSQSYIFAGGEISSLSVTSTRQGITSREILAVLKAPSSSSILSIPKRILDPRRPVNRDPTEAEREEGLLRYLPVIEVDPRSVINHRRELVGVKNVVTAPALLESTSLVFAWGGDLFASRVCPSLAFDVLGKGFSRGQLVGTVVALGVGVGIVAPMVRRKQINQRWMN